MTTTDPNGDEQQPQIQSPFLLDLLKYKPSLRDIAQMLEVGCPHLCGKMDFYALRKEEYRCAFENIFLEVGATIRTLKELVEQITDRDRAS